MPNELKFYVENTSQITVSCDDPNKTPPGHKASNANDGDSITIDTDQSRIDANNLLKEFDIGIGEPISIVTTKVITESDSEIVYEIARKKNGINALRWAFNVMEDADWFRLRKCLHKSIIDALCVTFDDGARNDCLATYKTNLVTALSIVNQGIVPKEFLEHAVNYYDTRDARASMETVMCEIVMSEVLMCSKEAIYLEEAIPSKNQFMRE